MAPPAKQKKPPYWLRFAFDNASRLLRILGYTRYFFCDVAALIGWIRIGGKRRNEIASRHRRADPTISMTQARHRAWRSYRNYFRTCLDFLWSHSMSLDEVMRYITILGLDDALAAIDKYGSAVFCLVHAGNWDVAAFMALAHDIPISTVMAPIGPPSVTQVAIWGREQRGLELFQVKSGAARGLLAAIKNGRCPAILCDIAHSGPTVEVPFRGGMVRFSSAPVHLSRETGVPLIPADTYRIGDHYCAKILAPVMPDGDDAEIMGKVAQELEESMRDHPEDWYPLNPYYVDE